VLPLPLQGLAAGAVLVVFAFALLALEGVLAAAERRAGSHLEGRLRIAFFEKIAQLPDSYFQSRPMADMLERSHGLHLLRTLPQLAIRVVRVGAELAVTTAAIMWLDPRVALIALVAGIFAAVIPIAGNVFIAPRDLKVRTHAGALAKFQLDALLGRTAIEAHRADAVIESEHDQRLAEWAKSSMSLQRASVAVEGVQTLIGFGLAGWVLFTHFAGGVNGAMLLMAYWVLNVPALGYELALIAREYPAHRNTVLRLLEPLRAPSETRRIEHGGRPAAATPGVSLEFQQVSVRAAGNQVLERVSIAVRPGTHVAIVGASGAGKSTLVGLLLGWYRAHSGTIRVDGDLLTAERVEQLRAETAWVDPSVQIWNASLLENLLYGSGASPQDVAPVLDAAALVGVIAKLPSGMATPLGESGALLSAGEGQRVRLGRAMMRDKPRLVILDEPFLGLERDRRRSLLAHARQRWAGATMLYVTHDVSETRAFDRVLVIEHGRVAEDGSPVQLAQVPSSRYRRLLQSQETVHARLNSGEWRRIRLENGRITSDHAAAIEQRA
ncbi:MAG TPA: ABC transporter ATP-binding protein, partial [Polyangiales bacterium]|nr:ABC transporter ATP-binding protein [Polyangiales bacterium]